MDPQQQGEDHLEQQQGQMLLPTTPYTTRSVGPKVAASSMATRRKPSTKTIKGKNHQEGRLHDDSGTGADEGGGGGDEDNHAGDRQQGKRRPRQKEREHGILFTLMDMRREMAVAGTSWDQVVQEQAPGGHLAPQVRIFPKLSLSKQNKLLTQAKNVQRNKKDIGKENKGIRATREDKQLSREALQLQDNNMEELRGLPAEAGLGGTNGEDNDQQQVGVPTMPPPPPPTPQNPPTPPNPPTPTPTPPTLMDWEYPPKPLGGPRGPIPPTEELEAMDWEVIKTDVPPKV